MDTTEITHLSLCSGYGGIDLGLKGVFGENVRTVAYAEIEAFAIECLLARMEGGQLDAAPIWPNLKSFPWQAFSDRVDILSGGYPCQPFSAAGKRLGTEDSRHLWPFIANGIRIMRPKLCFFENVEGHISLGLRAVIDELGSIGYKTTWGIFSAREVGAPHQRKRVFILAHLIDERLQGRVCGRTHQEWKDINGYAGCGGASGGIWPSRPSESQYSWEPPRVVGDAESRQDHRREPRDLVIETSQGGCRNHAANSTGKELGNTARQLFNWCGSGTKQRRSAESSNAGKRQTQSPLGRDANGTASGMDYAELCVAGDNRTDELRLLGNGVVPATATRAFLTLLKELNE